MSQALLVARNLTKCLGRRNTWLNRESRVFSISDAPFVLNRGQTFGLVGESGSGKTTIARLLAHLTKADHGSVHFDGVDLGTLSGPALRRVRRRMQIVSQDPSAAFDPRVRIGSSIAGPIRLHGLRPDRDVAKRIEDLLGQVGLTPDLANRFPHELSGGQLRRLAIARALAVEPDVIILDEVVSSLDVLVKSQILALLQNLQRDLGMAYVFISHNIADLYRMADAVGVLLCGRIVENGSTHDVFASPRHPYTRALLDAATAKDGQQACSLSTPDLPSQTSIKTGCSFADRCPIMLQACREMQSKLSQTGGKDHLSACIRTHDLDAVSTPAVFTRPLSEKARLRLNFISRVRE